MRSDTLTTGLTPEIHITQAQGNLDIKGWDRPEVYAKAGGQDTLTMDQQQSVVTIRCESNCDLRIPRRAKLIIDEVQGNLRLKQLDDSIEIQEVRGNLDMRSVGAVTLDKVHGYLSVRQMLDSLRVNQVSGNAVVRELRKECVLEDVSGSLDLRGVEGNIKVSAKGHIRARLAELSGQNYELNAAGHLSCQVSGLADLQVHMKSNDETIQVWLPNESNIYRQNTYDLTLGKGEAQMQLTAGGKIYFSSKAVDWEGKEDIDEDMNDEFVHFSEMISDQFNAQIEKQMEILNDHVTRISSSMAAAGMTEAEIERMAERVRASSEQAATRAQEKMRRAQEKLERKLAANQRKVEIKVGVEGRGGKWGPHEWNFHWPPSSPSRTTPPQQSGESASAAERLVILRMLQEKKISVEEAEKLLKALEGNG